MTGYPTPARFAADVAAAPARLAELAASLRGGSPWPAAVTRAERLLLQPQIHFSLDKTPFLGRAQHPDQFLEQR